MSSVRPSSTNNGLCSHLNFPSLLENDDRLSKRPLKDGADGWKMDGTDKMPVVQHIVQLGMKSIWWTASTLFLRRYCCMKRTWPSDLLAVSRNIDFLSHLKCIPQELTFHPKCIQLCRPTDLNFSESWQVGHLLCTSKWQEGHRPRLQLQGHPWFPYLLSQKLCGNSDGEVTMEEFLKACKHDPTIRW